MNLYMAPILGVTNCVYRSVYAKHFKGYSFAVAPFIKGAKVDSSKSKALRDIFPEVNSAGFGLVPQVLGNNSDDFILISKAMFDLGYKTVNWNLGCPHKRVRKKQRGSGLLSEPDMVLNLLDKILPNIPNELSLKVRLGSDCSQELFKLLPYLNNFSIKNIIIHPRIGSQMYSGSADVDAFEKCLSLTEHSVVYNGDIFSKADFQRLANRFPNVDNWMIGRGGIVDPFLPEKIKGIKSLESDSARFLRFHRELFDVYENNLSGSSHLLAKMKEIWYYWSQKYDFPKSVLKKIIKIKTVNNYWAVVEKIGF